MNFSGLSRLIRFILTQFVWMGVALHLFGNASYILSLPPSAAYTALFLPIGIALLLNLIIWFGSGLMVAFRDSTYEQAATRESDSVATVAPHKRKRETLDSVLRDLSDEQLAALRQRLQDGTIDDEVLHERIVGTDGELVQRQ